MTTAEMLQALGDPRCFPGNPQRVEVLQTHLSVVCLVDDLVYKLKKSVRLPFVDFASLAARRRACRDEVRLNRRLCPDTYLGTMALRKTDQAPGWQFVGALNQDSAADVDVAVVMRRLPADLMLDVMLSQKRVAAGAIHQLAQQIAAFHREAERSPAVLAAGAPDHLAAYANANFTELQDLCAKLPAAERLSSDLLDTLASCTRNDFEALVPVLATRTAQIMDGHGDLHARNICMTDPPTVYDCLEFSQQLRCGDTATENAFLVMDLRYRGAPELAQCYLESYAAASGDTQQAKLMPTLVSYRAMVRAKVAMFAAADTGLPESARAQSMLSARQHLQFAAIATLENQAPWWIVVCGPPATGKSTLCRAIAARSGWPHLATDVLRKQLAGLAPGQRGNDQIYTEDWNRRTYATLAARAAEQTQRGAPAVLLDGNFATQSTRTSIATAAKNAGVRLFFAELHVSAAAAALRAQQRAASATDASDADDRRSLLLHAAYEAFAATPPQQHLQLQAAAEPPQLIEQLLTHLLRYRAAPAATSG
jgi:aminoglycoside phosphotransferase family enzyme/predicted kinase